jgi:uncharacterized protein (UPF0216 family)
MARDLLVRVAEEVGSDERRVLAVLLREEACWVDVRAGSEFGVNMRALRRSLGWGDERVRRAMRTLRVEIFRMGGGG